MSELLPSETPPLINDRFAAFWKDHPIHSKGLPDEVVEQFRVFAAGVWNAARFELGTQHLSAMDTLHGLGLNPEFHRTLGETVDGIVRMVTNLRKDLDNSVPV